jgi:hypothetical protein
MITGAMLAIAIWAAIRLTVMVLSPDTTEWCPCCCGAA